MSAPVVDEAYKLKKKANNGIVYTFYWHISMVLAKGLRLAGVSPNAVSFFSLVFFVISGYLFYQGMNIGGACSFFMGILMDCTDGKLARMSRKTSNLGIWLDYNIDYIKPLFIYPPISLALYRQNGSISVVVWAFTAQAVISVLTIINMRWQQFPFAQKTKDEYVKKSKYHKVLKQFYFLEGIEPLVALFFAYLNRMEYYLIIWTAGTACMYLGTTITLGRVIAKKDREARLQDDENPETTP